MTFAQMPLSAKKRPDTTPSFADVLQKALVSVLEHPQAAAQQTPFADDLDAGLLLWTAARHTCLLETAKRARPRLTLLFGEAVQAEFARVLNIAIAAELIHAASLAHDDVIDEGLWRRGEPTLNSKWNNLTAVLSGDLMLSLGFKQLQQEPSMVLIAAIEVLQEMSCAAIEESQARGKLDLSKKMWRRIAIGKTGALFGWCGKAVALGVQDACTAKEFSSRFDRCGRELGVAFQLADDLKDILVNDGKDRYADLKNKNPSHPILEAIAQNAPIAARIQALWNQPQMHADEIQEIGNALAFSDVIADCQKELGQSIEEALCALGPVRESAAGQQIEHWAMTLGALHPSSNSVCSKEAS